jgi:hypothetical protein
MKNPYCIFTLIKVFDQKLSNNDLRHLFNTEMDKKGFSEKERALLMRTSAHMSRTIYTQHHGNSTAVDHRNQLIDRLA